MKRKESLVLIELLVMLAVFSLAAVWCLSIFAGAVDQSKTNAARDRGVIKAQNVAAVLSDTAGDMEAASARLGGTWDGTVWQMADADLLVTVTPVEVASPYLGKCEIVVTHAEGDVLYSLPVAWQITEVGDGT